MVTVMFSMSQKYIFNNYSPQCQWIWIFTSFLRGQCYIHVFTDTEVNNCFSTCICQTSEFFFWSKLSWKGDSSCTFVHVCVCCACTPVRVLSGYHRIPQGLVANQTTQKWIFTGLVHTKYKCTCTQCTEPYMYTDMYQGLKIFANSCIYILIYICLLHYIQCTCIQFIALVTTDQVTTLLNNTLEELSEWCLLNTLTPHPTKCEAMVLHRGSFIGPLFIDQVIRCHNRQQAKLDSTNPWSQEGICGKPNMLKRSQFLPGKILLDLYLKVILPSVIYADCRCGAVLIVKIILTL